MGAETFGCVHPGTINEAGLVGVIFDILLVLI